LHYEKFQDGTVKCIEDEIPFEVPEGWAWTRFSAITINRDSERKPISSSQRTDVAKIYDYYGASGKIDKIDKYIFNERLLLIGEDGANLVTRNKPIAFFAEGQYWVNNHAHCIDATDKFILEYLCSYINAISLEKYVTGSAQPKMTQDNMNSILIPLPPYSEQKHMSQHLNEVMYTVDNIEIGKVDINELVSKAKSKILDLAIRGKLVPQDPNDEPASVILERIRTEKEELIKQGKIKRDKKESVIFKGDDNSYYEKVGNNVNCIDEKISFELPEGWAFIRLNTAWELISGRDLSPSEYNNKNDGIPYITGASNFKNGHISLVRWTPVPQVITRRGDLLLTCKGTIGEIAHNNFGEAHIARQIMAIRNIYSLNVDFLALCIEYSMTKIKQAAKGLIPGISREDILNLVIPIPPTKEQENICNKLKATFSAIEHIEKSLN
jgi:type I restriction enzyme S subunit